MLHASMLKQESAELMQNVMVGFGHGFGVNGLCAYKLLHWGPPLMAAGIFAI